MPESDDTASALKNRRATAKTKVPTDPPNADVPPEIGVGEPARRYPLLRDPSEPHVLGASGMTLGGDHGGKYVFAEVDGVEHILPRGCTTPITRFRWHKGQRVLRAVYEAYIEDLAAKTEAAEKEAAEKEKAAS